MNVAKPVAVSVHGEPGHEVRLPTICMLIGGAWKIASALAAGCTIVLKPSEITPLTALRLAELALEAGLPESVLNIVNGYGHEAGQALVEHPGIDKIAFTGSTRVGKQIVQTCAKDPKRVTLELGGKSPSLIFADADLDQAAIGAALAIFFNSGQVCLAASRLYVERSVFDRGGRWHRAGRQDVQAGPWSRSRYDAGTARVESAAGAGARLYRAGRDKRRRPCHGRRDWRSGRLFRGADHLCQSLCRSCHSKGENFGPVLVATPFDDVDEVVKSANDTRYGLAANIWTRDLSRAHLTVRRLQAGTVWINMHGMNDTSAPFCGMKESGWGREVGEDGILHHMEKTVMALLGD